MSSKNIPEASTSTSTRLDALQDGQVPPTGFFGMVPGYYPTMYPIPGLGLSRPPLATLPNATIPASLFSPGAGGYGPGAVPGYPVPNYQGQSTMYPAANIIPPMFHINNLKARFQPSLYPFAGMFLGNTTATPVLSENTGHHEQPAPATFKWPLPIQVMIEQQLEDQVAQEDLAAGVEAAQACGSAHGQDCQTNVGLHGALSAPEVQHDPLGNPSAYSEQEEVENRMNENNDEEYLCRACNMWVLLRRKKHHERKHDPNAGAYVCRFCLLLGKLCPPLSRKDALKRHVDKKHPEYAALLQDFTLNILMPRRKNVREDLRELRQRMVSHLSQGQPTRA